MIFVLFLRHLIKSTSSGAPDIHNHVDAHKAQIKLLQFLLLFL